MEVVSSGLQAEAAKSLLREFDSNPGTTPEEVNKSLDILRKIQTTGATELPAVQIYFQGLREDPDFNIQFANIKKGLLIRINAGAGLVESGTATQGDNTNLRADLGAIALLGLDQLPEVQEFIKDIKVPEPPVANSAINVELPAPISPVPNLGDEREAPKRGEPNLSFAEFTPEQIFTHFPNRHASVSVGEALVEYLSTQLPGVDSGVYGMFLSHPLELYDEAMADWDGERVVSFISAGKAQVALLLGDGRVLKLVRPALDDLYNLHPDYGSRPFDLPILQTGEKQIDGRRMEWYIQPFIEILHYADTEAADKTARAWFEIDWYLSDRRPYQLGHDADGNIWLVGYEAVNKIPEDTLSKIKRANLTLEEYDSLRSRGLSGLNSQFDSVSEYREAERIIRDIGQDKFRLYFGDELFQKYQEYPVPDDSDKKLLIEEKRQNDPDYDQAFKFLESRNIQDSIIRINDARVDGRDAEATHRADMFVRIYSVSVIRIGPKVMEVFQDLLVDERDFHAFQQAMANQAQMIFTYQPPTQAWKDYFAKIAQ